MQTHVVTLTLADNGVYDFDYEYITCLLILVESHSSMVLPKTVNTIIKKTYAPSTKTIIFKRNFVEVM